MMTMMNEDFAKTGVLMTVEEFDEWLAALRSGEYKQTQNLLYDECTDSYCCLGVEQKIHPEQCASVDSFTTLRKINGGGLGDFGSRRLPYYLQLEASNKNDSGQSFEQIADWLEETVRPQLVEYEAAAKVGGR